MATSSAIPLNSIDLLTGENYYIWEMKVSAVLRSRKLYKTVIENPEPEDADQRISWDQANDEAFGIIVVTLSPEQAALFIGERKARVVWDELKRIHAGNAEDRRIDAALALKNIQMGDRETVDAYIMRARSLSTKCAVLGQAIPDRELVYYVVRGLHGKYENVASVLRPQRSATLEEVQQSLKEEENRYKDGNQITKGEKAYKAREQKGGKHWQQGNKKNCYVCGKPNHLAKDCWYRHEKEKQNQTNFVPRSSQASNTHKSKKLSYGRNSANIADKCTTEHALKANFELDIDNCFPYTSTIWTLDSGCTSHMTPRLDWMTDVQEINSKVNVAEDGRSITAEAQGNIKLSTTTSEGENINISINDVLYVPKLRSNLLSVRSLIAKGNQVVFDSKSAKIYSKKGELIAEATEHNRMFVMKTRERINEQRIGACLTAKSQGENEEVQRDNVKEDPCENQVLWHRRLGHLNEKYMKKLKDQEMTRGISFTNGNLGMCESCILGKLTQNPHPSIGVETTTRTLELVHMDLCSIPMKSLGGAKYIFVLVDSYSRRIFVSFLKSKDEAFEHFLVFKNRYENEVNSKIKEVRSDNGLEFVNERFRDLFEAEGIHHQLTVPYNPQSNGLGERANRTLLDLARTILIDSGLPSTFWAEAVSTACYLKNITPTKTGGNKTPMENWKGEKPTISHLRVFGCIAYYFIPSEKRNKLEPRANKGIFVGYSTKRKAYRIYDPVTESVHEVRSVKFNEKEKGVDLLKAGQTHQPCDDVLKYHKVLEVPHEQEINVRVNQDIPIIINEGRRDEPINEEPRNNQPENRRGRRLGDTNEVIQLRNRIARLEREERFQAEGVRRSARIQAMQQAQVTTDERIDDPKNYEEATKSEMSEIWKEAMQEEIDSLHMHNVWRLVERKPGMKIIKNKWIYTTKLNPDGSIDKRKARLVAVGSGQKAGVDFEESFSPVMRMESFRTLVAIAASENLEIMQYDVKTAYLYGELQEKVYMEQPKGFSKKDEETKICELQRSIYGLPQSGRCWNKKLDGILINMGFKKLESDPCIYTFRQGELVIYLGVYVDDLLAAGSSKEFIRNVMVGLQKILELKEKDSNLFFLGIEIKKKWNGYELSQKSYICDILGKFGLSECKPVKTPGDPNQHLDDYQQSPETDQKKYQEMIGSLMYLSRGTRPDICFQVSQLSQYNRDPREIHMIALKRICRYLSGTRHYALVYDQGIGQIEVSTDASWCSTSDAKSFTGYIVKIGNNLVNWRTSKQHLVALSSCEAELIAISEGVRELKWYSNFLSELGKHECVQIPLKIKTDSTSAIDWITNMGSHPRNKHINRKFFFVRDEVRNGNVELEFVCTHDMEADALTKSLGADKLGASINMWNIQTL